MMIENSPPNSYERYCFVHRLSGLIFRDICIIYIYLPSSHFRQYYVERFLQPLQILFSRNMLIMIDNFPAVT